MPQVLSTGAFVALISLAALAVLGLVWYCCSRWRCLRRGRDSYSKVDHALDDDEILFQKSLELEGFGFEGGLGEEEDFLFGGEIDGDFYGGREATGSRSRSLSYNIADDDDVTFEDREIEQLKALESCE